MTVWEKKKSFKKQLLTKYGVVRLQHGIFFLNIEFVWKFFIFIKIVFFFSSFTPAHKFHFAN